MKKILSLVVLSSLVMSLAACGNSKVEENQVAGKINVYTRDATSGTREAFEGKVGFSEQLTREAIEVSSNGDMATKVGADLQAIGYVSASTDFAANGITPLNYEGVEPTKDNVLNGSYALQRPFNFVTRAKGDFESPEIEQLVAAFLDYLVNSVEGREVVAGKGDIVDVDAGTPWDELKVNHPIVDRDNSDLTLVTVGSTSVEKSLKAAIETFQGLAGNFQFVMNHSGSGDGYKRVLGSEKDGANKGHIGFASRAFKTEESVNQGMLTGTYAIDAVVAVINKDNKKFDNISQANLQAIFKGELVNWEDIK